jgi:hypothetical protein
LCTPNFHRSLQMYILSSLFVYGIILVRLITSPSSFSRHDWPFLSVYLISAITNSTLLTLTLTTPPRPPSIYNYISLLTMSLRTVLFLAMAVISEISHAIPISLPDQESHVQSSTQPLKQNGVAQYGTFDAGPPRANGGHGLGANPPPQGGWISYIRSFQVSRAIMSANTGLFPAFVAEYG